MSHLWVCVIHLIIWHAVCIEKIWSRSPHTRVNFLPLLVVWVHYTLPSITMCFWGWGGGLPRRGGNVGWGEAFTDVTHTQTLSRHNVKTDGGGEATRQKIMIAASLPLNDWISMFLTKLHLKLVSLCRIFYNWRNIQLLHPPSISVIDSPRGLSDMSPQLFSDSVTHWHIYSKGNWAYSMQIIET